LRNPPKAEWIKVKVDKAAFAQAPKRLLPVGETRTGWLRITPDEAAAAVRFLEEIVAH
jgi:hypothetical protein